MPLSSSPSTQRRRVGGRGMLVNSIHGVDTLRYVVVHSGLSCTCFTEVLCSYAILYRLSTPNHNCCQCDAHRSGIVLYRLSTSNHNMQPTRSNLVVLSYIVFLHQTTTSLTTTSRPNLLSYIVFLHQTTTATLADEHGVGLSYIVFLHQTTTFVYHFWIFLHCLISSFYIKPQLNRKV